ncbi:MAG: hypothetical protein AABY13_01590 [Nanoarchaeota archaeon]
MTLGTTVGIVAGIVGVALALIAVLYATGLIKKGFQRSEGAPGVRPVSKAFLKAVLLKLNKPKHPFKVTVAKDTDLYVTWTVVDAKWIEVLGAAWLNKVYKIWVLLDDTTRTVRVNELVTERSFTAGASGVHGERSFFRGVQLWRKERAYRWGIRPDFSVGEIYNYKFNPSDLKDVIRQIANDRGWAFEVVTTKGQASFKR